MTVSMKFGAGGDGCWVSRRRAERPWSALPSRTGQEMADHVMNVMAREVTRERRDSPSTSFIEAFIPDTLSIRDSLTASARMRSSTNGLESEVECRIESLRATLIGDTSQYLNTPAAGSTPHIWTPQTVVDARSSMGMGCNSDDEGDAEGGSPTGLEDHPSLLRPLNELSVGTVATRPALSAAAALMREAVDSHPLDDVATTAAAVRAAGGGAAGPPPLRAIHAQIASGRHSLVAEVVEAVDGEDEEDESYRDYSEEEQEDEAPDELRPTPTPSPMPPPPSTKASFSLAEPADNFDRLAGVSPYASLSLASQDLEPLMPFKATSDPGPSAAPAAAPATGISGFRQPPPAMTPPAPPPAPPSAPNSHARFDARQRDAPARASVVGSGSAPAPSWASVSEANPAPSMAPHLPISPAISISPSISPFQLAMAARSRSVSSVTSGSTDSLGGASRASSRLPSMRAATSRRSSLTLKKASSREAAAAPSDEAAPRRRQTQLAPEVAERAELACRVDQARVLYEQARREADDELRALKAAASAAAAQAAAQLRQHRRMGSLRLVRPCRVALQAAQAWRVNRILLLTESSQVSPPPLVHRCPSRRAAPSQSPSTLHPRPPFSPFTLTLALPPACFLGPLTPRPSPRPTPPSKVARQCARGGHGLL